MWGIRTRNPLEIPYTSYLLHQLNVKKSHLKCLSFAWIRSKWWYNCRLLSFQAILIWSIKRMKQQATPANKVQGKKREGNLLDYFSCSKKPQQKESDDPNCHNCCERCRFQNNRWWWDCWGCWWWWGMWWRLCTMPIEEDDDDCCVITYVLMILMSSNVPIRTRTICKDLLLQTILWLFWRKTKQENKAFGCQRQTNECSF